MPTRTTKTKNDDTETKIGRPRFDLVRAIAHSPAIVGEYIALLELDPDHLDCEEEHGGVCLGIGGTCKPRVEVHGKDDFEEAARALFKEVKNADQND